MHLSASVHQCTGSALKCIGVAVHKVHRYTSVLAVHLSALVHQCTCSALKCTGAPVHFSAPVPVSRQISSVDFLLTNNIRHNMGKTGADRLRESLQRKKQKQKGRNARFYAKNKDSREEKRAAKT